jgi:transposase InsO family protein
LKIAGALVETGGAEGKLTGTSNSHLFSNTYAIYTMALYTKDVTKCNAVISTEGRFVPVTSHSRNEPHVSKDYRNLLRDFRMESSMSRKGECWDNAVTCCRYLLGMLLAVSWTAPSACYVRAAAIRRRR